MQWRNRLWFRLGFETDQNKDRKHGWMQFS